jgi:NAD(P)-dependent dehydrogenase (short-subunit alcohol dehydrogenase family)
VLIEKLSALLGDHGKEGIRRNAVAPGWIDTELNVDFINQQPDVAAFRAGLGKIHPLARTGKPNSASATCRRFWAPRRHWYARRFVGGRRVSGQQHTSGNDELCRTADVALQGHTRAHPVALGKRLNERRVVRHCDLFGNASRACTKVVV